MDGNLPSLYARDPVLMFSDTVLNMDLNGFRYANEWRRYANECTRIRCPDNVRCTTANTRTFGNAIIIVIRGPHLAKHVFATKEIRESARVIQYAFVV